MWPKLVSLSSSSSSPLRSPSSLPCSTKSAEDFASPMSSGSPLSNLEEEYYRALHTQSFIDIWAKANHQLNKTGTGTGGVAADAAAEQSPISVRYYARLPDFLLEPSQETLVAAAAGAGGGRRFHALLLDYFTTTLDSCAACTSLLASIDRARAQHRSLRRLLRSSSAAALAAHVALDNPLSPQNLARFHSAHAQYAPLLLRLTAAHRGITRRARLLKIAKRAIKYVAVAACGALAVVSIMLTVHAGVALAAALPAAAAGLVRRRRGGGWLERAGRQADAAARGAFIVGRDMDTLGMMVRRVSDEVDHERNVVRMVLRNLGEGQLGMVREVAREVEDGEAGWREQLAELEEHVYLCLLTINRSRRMVAEEMLAGESPAPAPEMV